MRSKLLQFALTFAFVAAGWGWTETRVAQADQVLRGIRSDTALAANWRRYRRWYGNGGAYGGPYWGGGYYGPYYNSPYASPPLYYNRIAPGVYYYY